MQCQPLKFTVERGWHEQMGPDNDTIVTTISFKDQPAKGQVKLDKLADIMQGYSQIESAHNLLLCLSLVAYINYILHFPKAVAVIL